MENKESGSLDWILISAVIGQLILGVFFVYSASGSVAEKLTGNPNDLFYRHLVSLSVSLLVAGLLFKYWSTAFLRKHALWLLILSLSLIVLTLVPGIGVSINGANRWLLIGSRTIYVMPIACLFLFVYFSYFLSEHLYQNRIRSFSNVKFFLIGAIYAVSFWLQPDISGALILAAVIFFMCLLAGQYKFTIISIVGLSVSSAFLIGLQTYQLERFIGFFSPFEDRFDQGYHLATSLIAVGGGDVWGVGYGEGIIKTRLPSAHDSFIYSAVIEETGVIGGLLLIIISIVIFYRSFLIAQKLFACQKGFEGLLVMGLIGWISLLSVTHMSGVLGLTPINNAPYPLISFGGTYLLVFLMAFSIILKFGSTIRLADLEGQNVGPQPVFHKPLFWCFIFLFGLVGYFSISTAVFNKHLDAQYLSATSYVKKLNENRNSNAKTETTRGRIVDRFGKVLAHNVPQYDVAFDPQVIDIKNTGLYDLAALLEVNRDHVRVKYEQQKSAKRRFVYLKRDVDLDTGEQIKKLNIKGVYLHQVDRRYYPVGPAAAHVIGIASRDNVGQEGIELQFDETLRMFNDKDLQLSIDKRIQDIAYKTLKSYATKNDVKNGSIIVTEIKSGQILAMVNYPSFDPNDRRSLVGAQLLNIPVSFQLEPGELIAPFTLLAATQDLKSRWTESVDTNPGYLEVDGHKIQDAQNYGEIDIATVLDKYSKVGLSKIALDMPQQKLYSVFADVGFGSNTGIEVPSESPGNLGHIGKRSQLEYAANSFGYGLLVTPIQVANAYMSIANNAQMTKLTLIKGKKPDWKPLGTVTSGAASNLRHQLQRSSTNKGSTSSVPDILVSGKRALIQKNYAGKYVERYTGMFVGMTPVVEPEILLLVLIDESEKDPYAAGEIAETIFNEIVSKSFDFAQYYRTSN